MAAQNNTKFQVNFKLADGTLINLYADDAAELDAELANIQDSAAQIAAVSGALANANGVRNAVVGLNATPVASDEPVWAAKSAPALTNATAGYAAPVAAAPAQPQITGSTPTCVHGPMKFVQGGVSSKTGKPYNAFYSCTSPDRANQCRTKSA